MIALLINYTDVFTGYCYSARLKEQVRITPRCLLKCPHGFLIKNVILCEK